MKTSLALALTLLFVAAPLGAQPISMAENNHPKLVVRKSENPIVPQRLMDTGVVDGEVRLEISVDSDGKLAEYLVLGYTHPGLVDATISALKRWEFDPPRWHGQPVSIQRELKFVFQNRGAVVTIDPTTFLDNYFYQLFPDKYSYRPSSFKELDRIPTPLNAQPPAVSKDLVGKNPAEVTVEFFIDESGTVRMPSVLEADNADLAAACAAAVRTWRFDPPTRRGVPTLVRVQQTFRFNR